MVERTNKVAIITGGGRGIGRAVAESLAADGAMVVVSGRTMKDLAETVRLIEENGGRAAAIACDVSCEHQVQSLFAQVKEEYGSVDILINNAGIGIFTPLAEMSLEDWSTVLSVNLTGAFLCAREAMRQMKGRGGRIVNIGSVVSLKGYANQGAYTASKHGMLGLTRVLALEGQADNIIVQIVCPGGVDTGLVGDARPDLDTSILMTPQEVAQGVMSLLAQSGNAVTDQLVLRRRSSQPFNA